MVKESLPGLTSDAEATKKSQDDGKKGCCALFKIQNVILGFRNVWNKGPERFPLIFMILTFVIDTCVGVR